MLVFGTRPEAIKMCPLVKELKTRKNIETVVCVTGQHREMLTQVLDCFEVVPNYNLDIMQDKQTLFDITTNIIAKITCTRKRKTRYYIGAWRYKYNFCYIFMCVLYANTSRSCRSWVKDI